MSTPRARHIWIVGLSVLAGLAIVGAGLGFFVAQADKPAGAGGLGERPQAGAQQVVDAIAEKWPLPNPRDNTAGCLAKADSTGPGCVSRITTDAVTVVELATEADAQHWETGMKASDGRRAGRFVLSWSGEQGMTSAEARDDMVTIAEGVS